MSENPTFQIPRDVIEPILQVHMQSAITQALGDPNKLIGGLVARVLGGYVDCEGKPCQQSTYHSTPLLQFLAEKCLITATKELLLERMETFQPILKEEIARQLGFKKNLSPLARVIIDAMVGGLTKGDILKYNLKISVGGE
jgi:hypothetical protein